MDYASSVDGEPLEYLEYVPTAHVPTVPSALVVLLHGAGGNMAQYDTAEWRTEADQHGAILAMQHARILPGFGASRLSFFMDGALVPAQQDVLDLMPVAMGRHLIDPDRVYIAGYSMGGVGALNIATQNPGVFAAVSAGAPMSDLFQQWAFNPAASAPNFASLFGGPPGQDVLTDTRWYQNSPRFLLRNLMHTPLRVVHGTNDTLIPNATTVWPYMQSRHVVDTPGFADARGTARTLGELATAWPGSFVDWHLWPNADHGGGSFWWTADDTLTFFDAHERAERPTTVALTTFDDQHHTAWWLRLDLVNPWTAVPGHVVATLDVAVNAVTVAVAGSITATLDIGAMGLTTDSHLTADIVPDADAELETDLAVHLVGDWTGGPFEVVRDSSLISPADYEVTPLRLTLWRQPVDAAHQYLIRRVIADSTATATSSPGFSPTASETPNQTATATGSSSVTASPTHTATSIPTSPEPTSSSTSTPFASATATGNATPGEPPSVTPTLDGTATESASATATGTPAPTEVPSNTPTGTSSPAATQSPEAGSWSVYLPRTLTVRANAAGRRGSATGTGVYPGSQRPRFWTQDATQRPSHE